MTRWVFEPGCHIHVNRETVGREEIYRPVVVAQSAVGPGAQIMDHNSDLIDILFAISEGRHSCKIVCRLSE